MNETVNYHHFHGNLRDKLAAGQDPLRLDRAGVFVCMSGEAEVSLDDQTYTISERMLCVYFPYSKLQVKYRSDDLDGIVLSVDMDSIQPALTKISDIDSLLNIRQHPVVQCSPQVFEQIVTYMQLYLHHQELAKQHAELDSRRLWQLNNMQTENIKNCLMLEVVIAFSTPESRVKNAVNRKDEVVVNFFRSLKVNYRTEHEVGYYAAKQFLSMRYFSYVVRERTGHTPSHWISESLLADAKQMLTETDRTVKEIADELHFPNQSYFGKWFKAKTGKGPMQFKRHVNNN